MVDGKAPARTPVARHHLVGDQQHTVLPADLGEARPVVVGRLDRARGRADDRLRYEGGDGVGTLALDDPFDLVGTGHVAGPRLETERKAQAVARRCARRVEEVRLEAGLALGVAADRERRQCCPVVGEVAADHLPAPAAPGRHVVLPRQPDGGVDRLGPAAREHDAREPAPRPVRSARSRSVRWAASRRATGRSMRRGSRCGRAAPRSSPLRGRAQRPRRPRGVRGPMFATIAPPAASRMRRPSPCTATLPRRGRPGGDCGPSG